MDSERRVRSTSLDPTQQAVETYVRTLASQHLSFTKARTRRLLDILRGHIRSLGPVEAHKSIVLLSAGFLHRALATSWSAWSTGP